MDRFGSVFIVQILISLLLFLTKGGESILHGTPVLRNDYPFMVIIQKEFDNGSTMDLCSGIIINKEWILTLAICIYVNFLNNPLNATIYLGNNNKSLQKKYLIKNIQYHPGFELQSFPKNNLALLQLQSHLEFTETIKNIELYAGRIRNNARCSVSGWGSLQMVPLVMEELLHYDNMTVLNQATCKSKWTPYITGANLCTKYVEGRGLAYGDMGGALVMQGKLIAVAGFADVSGMQLPDVYWRIQVYKDWIKNTVASF